MACTAPSPESHIHCPSPRPLWSSFQELSEVLSPGCSPHFIPNKTRLAVLTVCVIFSRQAWRPVKRPRVTSLLCLNSTRTPSLGTTSSPSSPPTSSGVQTNLGKSPLALGSPAEAEDPEFLFCFSNMGRGTRALPTDLALATGPRSLGTERGGHSLGPALSVPGDLGPRALEAEPAWNATALAPAGSISILEVQPSGSWAPESSRQLSLGPCPIFSSRDLPNHRDLSFLLQVNPGAAR